MSIHAHFFAVSVPVSVDVLTGEIKLVWMQIVHGNYVFFYEPEMPLK